MGEMLAKFLFRQIVEAVNYLHTVAKVVHRDLKLENIVLDRNYNVKLCDFAMSKTIAEGSMTGVYYSQVGSERYMAPEIVEGRPYKGMQADMFALGVTLFAMATGVMPFERRAHKDTDQLYRFIYKGDDAGYWSCLDKMYSNESYFVGVKNLSDDFKRFVMGLLRYDYYERSTLEQVRHSHWLGGKQTNATKHELQTELNRRKSLFANL